MTRKIGDELQLGDDIRIKLIRVKGRSRVSLGIEAPPEYRVRRGESDDVDPATGDEE